MFEFLFGISNSKVLLGDKFLQNIKVVVQQNLYEQN